MTEHPKVRRAGGWLAAIAGLGLALALAGYGVWSRQASVTNLQRTADNAAQPSVQIASAKHGPPTQNLTLPGEVRAWNEAPIYGQVSGYVTQWFEDYGAHVNAGDLLARVETPSLDAQLAAAKASLSVSETRYNLSAETAKRYDALTTAAVTQQQKDQMDANAAADKAQVAAAEQTVEQFEAMTNFKSIVAPFAGIVTARRVSVGDFINGLGGAANQQASAPAPFSVADVSRLRVFISVPQAYGSVLKPGLKADLTLPGDPGRKIPAQFLTMAGAVVPSTRTIVTELVVENLQDGLWPGAYVNVNLAFPTDPNVLIIPSQALLFRANGMQVALVDDQDHMHLQNVSLGRNLGLDVEVTAGLKATDKFVANPSLGLLDGQQVKVTQPATGNQPGQNQAGQAGPPAVTPAEPKPDPNAPASQPTGDGTQAVERQ
ncbi:MAG TPA: efflux RND transporter periplasmic adaptor subunit [Phenylobacterium sp.]